MLLLVLPFMGDLLNIKGINMKDVLTRTISITEKIVDKLNNDIEMSVTRVRSSEGDKHVTIRIGDKEIVLDNADAYEQQTRTLSEMLDKIYSCGCQLPPKDN